MKYNYKNIVRQFFLILGVINLCVFIQTKYISATENKLIKVGYSNIEGFTEIKDGFLSGFSYEYLREISKYTGWEYEFIEMDLNEMMEKLRDGEIDIAGGMLKNEQTMKLYDFPEYNSGNTYTTLAILKNNNDISALNYETLNGIKVGYFESGKVRYNNFKNFCEDNDIKNIELIPYVYETGNELKEALEAKEVDAIISGDLLMDEDEKVIAKFGAVPYYFATTKGNTEIISGLNKAISRIKERTPDYDQQLYNKYFKTSNDNIISLTKEEQNYINNMAPLKIAYISDYLPLQYYNNSTDSEEGIFIDVSKLISEKSGLKIDFVDVETYEKAYEMLNDGRVDLVVGVPSVYSIADKYNFALTQPFMKLNMIKVVNKNRTADKEVMALPIGYGYSEADDDVEIRYYKNIEECLVALQKGEVTKVYGNSYTISNFITNNYYSNLSVISENKDVEASIAVSKPINKTLVNILNKAISAISEEEIQNIVNINTMNIKHSTSLKQVFVENMTLCISVILVVLTSIITLISIIVRMKFKNLLIKKELLLEKAQKDILTGTYNRETFQDLVIKYLNEKAVELYGCFIIIDIDYFKQVNDKLGHKIGDDLLVEFGSILKEVFSYDDIICRLGGDEFVVFMVDIDENHIKVIDEKLLKLCQIMNREISYNECSQRISLSIGATVTKENINFNKLYEESDKMLYEVKHNGKNGYKVKIL